MKREKINLLKEFKSYYTARTEPEIVDIEEGKFLTIEGKGAPGGDEFKAKVNALYSLAYGVKMLMKKQGEDFTVAKLEGFWWVDSDKPWHKVPREEWCWKLLIRQPDFITPEIVKTARQEVIKKKKMELVKGVRFKKIKEGKCVQILHIGPYSTEPESLAKMKELMEKENLTENGPHHEIYLVMSYPRKVPEERLKTILRQPVKNKN
ncbi:GyrI-like domain-containing protein [SCandidatus Aminicenantes bacterium Aminicenantia_JdfR_composite]|jgi:hypothetical protein|nr:GyrI-like domain-containing protein [SCandidatus Aminicenantes bacterium Aminicenantia_JdfR_composite]MCP2597273.1 GyrI-like domain-containing protein [Candidatus Aminicenantes bacterium AC-335-G13]MCP2605863.1 GyrI-like domain-containing protein [Candidatus Aminicenantes bacterium AC-335-O07]MCP2620549.1 GyrI-like domain-containing protein [Candidatus Aminicenantes bacterium AC-334-E05]